ncbi:MAG: mechanosensitive ion channel family protein [Mariprofundaceae bacterium]|nr:mechanosensitive ion channel family protein [Mariprofundaceae bacterium]
MEVINVILAQKVLDIPVSYWLLSSTLLLLGLYLRHVMFRLLHQSITSIAKKTATPLDDILFSCAQTPISWMMLLIVFMGSIHILQPHGVSWQWVRFSDRAAVVISILIIAWFLWSLVGSMEHHFRHRAALIENASLNRQLVPFMARILKIILLVSSILMVVQNMGYSISALIASLGIGGIAVAMAAKDTISNFFGSVMLLLDRPFQIGNWIKTSEFEGVVEDIGFRSTRIRTFAKTLINVPNSLLANMVVDNIDAMPKRRVKMRIGVTYATSPAKVQLAVDGVKAILVQHSGVDQEFILVNFDEFEGSSLSIFIYYFSSSSDWADYLQVRQEVNLKIMLLLESLGIEFAFPSQSVYLEGEARDLARQNLHKGDCDNE